MSAEATAIELDDDKFHDECGLYGIWNHAEAANVVYLGLYALQHRGQESAGIASTDGDHFQVEKAMGWVADVFSRDRLKRLPGHRAIGAAQVQALEDALDAFNDRLPPLKEFILPGGGPAAAACHLARAICRRAERRSWTLARAQDVAPEPLQYLNRLSDLLFVLARVLARHDRMVDDNLTVDVAADPHAALYGRRPSFAGMFDDQHRHVAQKVYLTSVEDRELVRGGKLQPSYNEAATRPR